MVKRRTQNLISDEFASLLAEEGAIRDVRVERVMDRMILRGEQLRHILKPRKFKDSEYRIDEV